MISINLIPDVKANYLKSQQTKYAVMLSAFVITALFVGATLLLWLFTGFQKQVINGVEEDIDNSVTKISQIENLEQIVTVKNQLDAIPGLHDQKPVTSRLFNYLVFLVPDNIGLSKASVDYSGANFDAALTDIIGQDEVLIGGGIELSGKGDSFRDVNTFADGLKNATFTSTNTPDDTKAFYNVTLKSISKDAEEGAFFTIQAAFHENLFSFIEDEVLLKVPSITSSPSVQSELFTAPNPDEAQLVSPSPSASPTPDPALDNQGGF